MSGHVGFDPSTIDNTGTFHGAVIDYGEEYTKARELMGTIGTDLDDLRSVVGHLYFQCPEVRIEMMFRGLLLEITKREMMIMMKPAELDIPDES